MNVKSIKSSVLAVMSAAVGLIVSTTAFAAERPELRAYPFKTSVTVATGATLPDALFAGCTALDESDWSQVATFGQAALAGIPTTTISLNSLAALGAYALAADATQPSCFARIRFSFNW